MPKFMLTVTYTIDGARGLLKEGASGRRGAVEKLVQSVGGKIDALYFSFGDADAYLVVDLPDAISAAAISLNVAAAAGAHVKTSPLLSVEDFDQAAKKKVNYRAPGA